MSVRPELSIVVPALNDAEEVAGLLADLAEQEGTAAEVIVVDGGSTDGTAGVVAGERGRFPFPVRLVAAERGRGRQLNRGAAEGAGGFLLFLHADSRFPDRLALRTGLDELRAAGGGLTAGHFTLRFRRRDVCPSLPYFFYEQKARLDRPECTHGDQGLLLCRELFFNVGPFDETAPVAPETRFADRFRGGGGKWLLLTPEILTSARRFETEGLRERQTLNAVIMNLAAAGRDDFITALPGFYADQGSARRLDLRPFLAGIHRLIRDLPAEERKAFRRASARHFRSHAWQIPFLLDVRRHVRRFGCSGSAATPLLDRYDRFVAPRIDSLPLRGAAHAILAAWLRLSLVR